MKNKEFPHFHEITAKCLKIEPIPVLKEKMAWSFGGRPLGLAGVVGFLFEKNELFNIKPTDIIVIPLNKVHDKKYIPKKLNFVPKSWKWNNEGKFYSIPLNMYQLIQYLETHNDFVYVEDNLWNMNSTEE